MSTATTEQPVVDLRPFVSRERGRTSYLLAPWSAGRWTYATNGIVAVRVPRRADVKEETATPAARIDTWLDDAPLEALLRAMPAADCTPPGRACDWCDGRGTEHNCPSCDCDCEQCNGSGDVAVQWSVEWFGQYLDGNYWQAIAALPGARIATAVNGFDHLRFTFDGGGSGAIKPMLWPYSVLKRLTPEVAP